MNKVYFPNLNGLRFIAALLVLIHHTEQIKKILGLANFWSNPFVRNAGSNGVTLFFVLSGFLITYLLLEEQKQERKISIKDFYIRRILRIWPLYYLIIVLSFFILPHISFFNIGRSAVYISEDFSMKLLLFSVFLPNIANLIYSPVSYASQSWSVGVEEQFYLIWPVLMQVVKKKEFALFGVLFIYLFMNLIGFPFIKTHLYWNNALNILMLFWINFKIDCMAIGGIFALILFRKYAILTLLYNKAIQALSLITLLILIVSGREIPYLNNDLYAVFFGILILNLAANKKTIVSLENKLFNFFGKISYGLYMFHAIGIVISLKLLISFHCEYIPVQYLLSFIITVLFASASYYLFEKRFISLKVKFSKILSGS